MCRETSETQSGCDETSSLRVAQTGAVVVVLVAEGLVALLIEMEAGAGASQSLP